MTDVNTTDNKFSVTNRQTSLDRWVTAMLIKTQTTGSDTIAEKYCRGRKREGEGRVQEETKNEQEVV